MTVKRLRENELVALALYNDCYDKQCAYQETIIIDADEPFDTQLKEYAERLYADGFYLDEVILKDPQLGPGFVTNIYHG